jgi:membrane-associated phospholipid phosphatase
MSLGVHYPTDVLAAIAVAALVSLACFSLLKRREKKALLSEKDMISEEPSSTT